MHRGALWWQLYRWPLAATAAVLALTVVAYTAAAGLAERQSRQRFDVRTLQIQEAIGVRLQHYVQTLRGGASMFDAVGPVSRDEWRTYVDGLAVTERFPGFQGVGYTQRLRADELDEHEAAVRAEGFPDYRVTPDEPRAEYHAIVFLEPFDWRNRRAFGYDMYTEPVRREAMQRARDRAEPAMSGKVTLVQETDEDVQAGFLVYYPVYRGGGVPATIAGRQDRLLGYVYSPVRMDDLLHGILGSRNLGVDFEVYDAREPSPGNRMYSTLSSALTGDATARARFTGVRTLDFAGRSWTLAFFSRPEFEAIVAARLPELLLGGGLFVSLLVFGIVGAGQARRRGDIAHAQVIDSAMDAVVSIDAAGRVLEFNSAAERLFGYRRAEVLGRDMGALIVPPNLRALHDAGMERFRETGRTRIAGRLLEMDARRADGTTFPAEVTITRVQRAEPLVFSGFIRDISGRKAQENALRELNADLERRVRERTAALETANRELEAFASSVSHDLRAPLRAIGGFAGRLRADYGASLSPDAAHAVDRIVAAATRMRQLIDDLLALARVSRVPLRYADLDLSALAHDVAEELRTTDPTRMVEFEIEPTPPVRGDQRMLRIVLENLLGNAWKFTSHRPDAHIRFGARGDGFFVEDDGAGFDPAYAHRLFQPFHRLHADSEFPGTGIGLATVARIVERHGGTIRAEGAPGRGATIRFTLGTNDGGSDD